MDPQSSGTTGIQQDQQTSVVQSTPLPQDVQIPVEVQVFLEDLINEANIPVFDDATKQQIVRDLFDRLDKFIAMKIADNLSEEDTEAFIKLNEEGKSREEIDAFIAEHIPDAQGMFTQAFVDFRDFYLTAQSNFEEVAKAGNPK